MTHRAALYSVIIHPKQYQRSPCILGDYDGSGTWLGKTLKKRFRKLQLEDPDRGIALNYELTYDDLPRHHIGFTFLRGQTGVTSVLSRPQEDRYYRTPDTAESLRVAAIFHLPRAQSRGYLAIYVPHRHGIKTLLDEFLRQQFGPRGYVLTLNPIVPQDALRQAIETNGLERITLIKRELAESDRFADAAQWGDDQVDRVELSIVSKRGLRLRRDPLSRFLTERNDEDLARIVEFDGMRFDDAKVTAKMPSGSNRTFYLDGRETGHAMTFELDLRDEDTSRDRLGILPDTLRAHLIGALSELSPDH